MPTSRGEVPHSLRGMALGQLQHLEALFVKSGWLDKRCKSFNRYNKKAISMGKRFKQAPNLYALDTFVVTPMSQPGNCPARQQDDRQAIPAATRKSSFSELLNPNGLYVHCFVSHFWGHAFSSTVQALGLWATRSFQSLGTGQQQSVVFWVCLFALNQHDVAAEVGVDPQQGPFNAALSQATGGAVMVLDEQINPFRRLWCLFEVARLKGLQRPFELISVMGSLSRPESFGQHAEATEMLQATCRALWEVSAAKAESSVAADKYQIWAATCDSSFRSGLDAMDAHMYFDGLRFCLRGELHSLSDVFSEFDGYIKSLLSTNVLQLLLSTGDYASAAQCCSYGARFDEEQLRKICASFPTERARVSWLNELLLKASDVSTAQMLLQLGADGHAVSGDDRCLLASVGLDGWRMSPRYILSRGFCFTALEQAALSGHEDVVMLLLQRNCPESLNPFGLTALIAAAHNGHEDVVKILLQHGFDAQEPIRDGTPLGGFTPLMFAAYGGHEPVARLLLQHAADATATSNDGDTALIGAAQGGHEAVARLLLQHGAALEARDRHGGSALVGAAMCGHAATVKLLLNHRADAGSASNTGFTALMGATQFGHEAVAKLLLEHHADATVVSKNGVTALRIAARGRGKSLMKLLLKHGASRMDLFWLCASASNRSRSYLQDSKLDESLRWGGYSG